MKIYEYKEGMSPEEQANGAYWERNMLALDYATQVNKMHEFIMTGLRVKKECIKYPCGWYYDTENNWDGWHRVISLMNGSRAFHIPDDFDIGDLPQIEPNWDGHTTREKWLRVMRECGINTEME